MEEKLKQSKSSCIKIVVFGPESSGKTTLVKQLAKHYHSLAVPEYARIYAEKKLKKGLTLTKHDILPIAIGQMALENKYAQQEKNILFCDTNLLETKIYAEEIYNGYCPESIKNQVSLHQYNVYILTDIDIPWEYDPVRSSAKERQRMFQVFKSTLENNHLPYLLVSGNQTQRLKIAIDYINKL